MTMMITTITTTMMTMMTMTVGWREACADSRLKLSALLTGEIAALLAFFVIIIIIINIIIIIVIILMTLIIMPKMMIIAVTENRFRPSLQCSSKQFDNLAKSEIP